MALLQSSVAEKLGLSTLVQRLEIQRPLQKPPKGFLTPRSLKSHRLMNLTRRSLNFPQCSILQTVSGYHLEFETTPHQVNLPKFPKFSESETVLIESEIRKVISKGAVIEVFPCDNELISTVFLVPKKTGDFRPVINLKPLNQFVEKIHFKMENIHMALNCISPFSVPIFHPHRRYLRFLWNLKGYEFTCLPFGYSLAPRVFTKISALL